jgi:hypothetical protein
LDCFICPFLKGPLRAQNDVIVSLKIKVSETEFLTELLPLLHQLVLEPSYYNPEESIETAQSALNLS